MPPARILLVLVTLFALGPAACESPPTPPPNEAVPPPSAAPATTVETAPTTAAVAPSETASPAPSPEPAPLPLQPPVAAPVSVTALRTTAGSIAVTNLEAQLNSAHGLSMRTASPVAYLQEAGLLMQRARIIGRREDIDRAVALVDGALAGNENPRALLMRASLRAHDHRFEEALVDVARAVELDPALAAEAAAFEAEVRFALGDVERSVQLVEAVARDHRELTSLASLANVRVEQGRYDEAERLFTAAQHAYLDTHPLPLAWLHVQHGVMVLRRGDPARAHDFFAAAYERLPQFYLAAEHLAETEGRLGNLDRAAELYAAVIEQTDNPEFYHALAGIERARGRLAEAEAAEAAAQQRYEALLAAHPAAYGQHAAEFFLDRGETARALELARQNATLRQNAGSLLLHARAADAAGQRDEACEAWSAALATGLHTPEMATLAEPFASCRLTD